MGFRDLFRRREHVDAETLAEIERDTTVVLTAAQFEATMALVGAALQALWDLRNAERAATVR